MKPKYEIGETLFWARHLPTQTRLVCPDCCGKRYFTIILGDDSSVTAECPTCGQGYEPAKGYVTRHTYAPFVEGVVIVGMEIRPDGIKYQTSARYSIEEAELFKTEPDAHEAAEKLAAAYQERKDNEYKNKVKDFKSWAWQASYHRREIKDLTDRLAYHTKRLEWAKVCAKEAPSSSPETPTNAG